MIARPILAALYLAAFVYLAAQFNAWCIVPGLMCPLALLRVKT